MQHYQDLHSDSGVSDYETGPDYITVRFRDGSNYKYTCLSAGQQYIKEMKRLAIQGYGLNSFINTYVKHSYAAKWQLVGFV